MKLEPGMLIKTNYSGPYRIVSIKRGCTCKSFVDELNGTDESSTRPHIHMVLADPDNPHGTPSYLGRWDESTLKSLDMSYCGGKTELDYDEIEILPQDRPVQLSLF